MTLWFPYTQMKSMYPPIDVVSAERELIMTRDKGALIDGISSWWCVIHGYSHPAIVNAMCDQTVQLAHVMLGGLVHEPARQLADRLAAITPGDLNHVFFSDSGSVGVEVAIKMAVQYCANRGQTHRHRIAFLEGAYHGDTTGAMAVCDPLEGMHRRFYGVVSKQVCLKRPPAMGHPLVDYIRECEAVLRGDPSIAALIVEPIMQGAGGFYLYDPAVLVEFRRLCDELDIVLIADEVATGFGRLGRMFAVEFSGIVPDIMVLGKGLTGGHIGLAGTLAREHIYNGFLSDEPGDALMHGPTFMGNPVACRAALASIELVTDAVLDRVGAIESHLMRLKSIESHSMVKSVRVMGAMGVVEMRNTVDVHAFTEYSVRAGVWLRPFGHFIYTMPPYCISDDHLERVIDVMVKWVREC